MMTAPFAGWPPSWLDEACRSAIPSVGVRPCQETKLQKETLVASERDRPDVAHQLRQWRVYQNRISRPVFIDETWIETQ